MARSRRVYKLLAIVLGVIGALLATAFFVAQKNAKLIDKQRFALVETIGDNYVVRGNNPFAGNPADASFDFNQLTDAINGALARQGKPALPASGYYLIDLSLLDVDQYFLIRKEAAFFEANPQLGRFLNISTVSPGILATSLDSGLGRLLTNGYNASNTKLLQQIRDLASQRMDRPVVVFVHCDAGRDRTGYVISSYRMYFNNMTLSEAEVQNVKDAGRTSRDYYHNATRSYCRYLDTQRPGMVSNRCAEPDPPLPR